MESKSSNTVQVQHTCMLYTKVVQDFHPIWIMYFVICINVILCFTATIGNMLILVALQRDCHLHAPSKRLFRSLAATDLCVGLISQPCFVIFVILAVRQSGLSNCQITEAIVHISSAVLCSISLCTLTAISVDRLLALRLGLRYRQVVTVKRVRGIIILSWLVVSSLGMLHFWNTRIFLITLCAYVLLCLSASTFCYMKIYFTLRHRQAQVAQQSGPDQLYNIPIQGNVLRYKKTVSSSMWVYLTMIAFNLPFAIVIVVRTIQGESRSTVLAEGATASLVFFNSSLNPVIYCWKIREVRQAVKTTIRRFGSICF